MSDNYTPSTPHVRQGYVRARIAYGDVEHATEREAAARDEFDRWLGSVRAGERERIARNIEAKTPDGRKSAAFCAGMDRDVRIVREGA